MYCPVEAVIILNIFRTLSLELPSRVWKKNFFPPLCSWDILFSRFLFISSFPILSLLNLALVLPSTTVDSANSLVTLLLTLNRKFQGKRVSCRLTLGTLGQLFFLKQSRKGTNSEIHMCTANALNPFPHLPNFLSWPTARNRFYIIILHTNINIIETSYTK